MPDAAPAPAVAGEHLQKQTLTVQVFVPDHPDRTTTPIFAATRRKLIENNPDACCYICDGKDDLQLHHFWVEWCDSGAVDWAKVAEVVPDFDWANFDPAKPETFIDSEWNANLVLCSKHHIGGDHGIHTLPYGLWLLQRLKRPDFVFSPDEAAAAP
jgi:hypothetical protein